MMRLAGYIRVSTDEQANGHGLDAQLDAITRACELRGDTLVAVHKDVVSTRRHNRPGLQKTLAQVAAGQADGIVVAKLDRLSRSTLQFAELTAQAEREGWVIVALDLGVDTSTATGKLISSVIAAFAEFERELISERTKAGLRAAQERGTKLGRPRTVPEETLERIRELRARKFPYAAIARVLNREAVPTGHGRPGWHPKTVAYHCKRK